MKRWALGAMLVLVFVGCKHGRGSSRVSAVAGGDEPHHPDITSEFPRNDSAGAAVGTLVMATFDDPMNAASINTGSFSLQDSGGLPVAGIVTYNATTRTATFSPSMLLMPSTVYIASLAAGITNTMGNSLGVGFSWKFKTAP